MCNCIGFVFNFVFFGRLQPCVLEVSSIRNDYTKFGLKKKTIGQISGRALIMGRCVPPHPANSCLTSLHSPYVPIRLHVPCTVGVFTLIVPDITFQDPFTPSPTIVRWFAMILTFFSVDQVLWRYYSMKTSVFGIFNNYYTSARCIWDCSSQLRATRLVGYNHLISNKPEWNNCFIENATKYREFFPTLFVKQSIFSLFLI